MGIGSGEGDIQCRAEGARRGGWHVGWVGPTVAEDRVVRDGVHRVGGRRAV